MISDPSLFLLPVEVSIMIIINQKKPPKKPERLVDSVRGWHHLFPVKTMKWPPKWKSRVFLTNQLLFFCGLSCIPIDT